MPPRSQRGMACVQAITSSPFSSLAVRARASLRGLKFPAFTANCGIHLATPLRPSWLDISRERQLCPVPRVQRDESPDWRPVKRLYAFRQTLTNSFKKAIVAVDFTAPHSTRK